ncbi:MAG: pyridoxamine 5'-phosphate oxidase family protein [Pseudomonadota bacterium]
MPLAGRLTPTLIDFIRRQPMFFVATAAPSGRVNLSPKGADTLRVMDETRLRWLNLSGSGNETAGHLRQANRMTLMFCSFVGKPLILRVYGHATTLHPHDDGWEDAVADFEAMAGSRQVFDVTVESVQTSCGSGVPLMAFNGQRAGDQLVPFFEEMGPDGVTEYWQRKNAETIDGFETGVTGGG